MFGTTFGYGTLRRYVIFMGTLFNNIHINRYDADDTLVQNFKVPLSYGPREKFLARVDGNPDLDRAVAIQLPRMSFQMTGLYYDPQRTNQRLTKIPAVSSTDPNVKYYQYTPVPYNMEFTLSIMTKNAEDGTFIVEQILPFFTPDFTATLLLNPDLGHKSDIAVSLNSVSQEDTYEGDFINRRAIIWTLNFVMKGYLFGPTKTGAIIKEIDIDFRLPGSNTTIESATPNNTPSSIDLVITPGLTANGHPVNWYGSANAAIRPTTVAANTIHETDNYGWMNDFTDNF
jgi:hypothetical protein